MNDISEQWKNENQHIKEMSEACVLQDFGSTKSQRQPPVEFKVVKFMTETQYHVEKLYKNVQQFGFNRSNHIMTFDPTRVRLGPEEKQEEVENYINANYVEIEGKKLIACQGPMHCTFYNFWRMIQENKVEHIFMLCLRVEKTKPKCDAYWLYDDAKDGVELRYEIVVSQEDHLKNITTRRIDWKNSKTGKTGTVTHYQLHGWNDGDRPTEAIKDDLMELVNKNIELISNDQITVIHCSAGVGRTGTFIAMSQLLMQLRNKKPISIFESVRKLRQQRWGMVYTQLQYEYLYEFVEEQIKAIIGPDSDLDGV